MTEGEFKHLTRDKLIRRCVALKGNVVRLQANNYHLKGSLRLLKKVLTNITNNIDIGKGEPTSRMYFPGGKEKYKEGEYNDK